MCFLPHSLLHFAAELIAGEFMHAVVLVEEDVRGDVVVDKLDDEENGVLRRPVELLVVPDVPLVSAVTRSKVHWLIDVGNFLHE